jgi:anti-sigma B factor antagonist
VESQSPNIVVDLQDVRYMDSSGVATLIEGYKLCQKNNGRFVLAGLKPEVREVFELTRLDRVFEIYDTSQLALESIA